LSSWTLNSAVARVCVRPSFDETRCT